MLTYVLHSTLYHQKPNKCLPDAFFLHFENNAINQCPTTTFFVISPSSVVTCKL